MADENKPPQAQPNAGAAAQSESMSQAAIDAAIAAAAQQPTADAPDDAAPQSETLDHAAIDAAIAAEAASTGGSQSLSQDELDAVLTASGLQEPEPSFSMSDEAASFASANAATAVADAPPDTAPFVLPNIAYSRRASANDDDSRAIELINDVSLDVKVELGRARMLVEDVLRLGSGSVVELDKLAGDPVDIFVNERLVARGEVLVLNDDFCVRISEIITPAAELAAG